MAKSTTFYGQPKPMGKSGHFNEPNRHALQAKGIRTGHLANTAVYEQYGLQNLEKPYVPDVPTTAEGLENVEEEAIQQKASLPKKVPLGERLKKIELNIAKAYRQEQEARALAIKQKSEERRASLYKALDKEEPELEPEPEPDEEAEETEEEYDSDSLPARLGTFLANVTDEYTSEDMAGLSDKELEMLAVRFKIQTKDALFGTPENPFVDELKSRMEARAELKKEKAEIRAELRKPKKEEKGILADFF